MLFRKLEIRDWQQFGDVEIDFHDRLTVLTGANGAGKTTLLRFLARHFGWDYQSLRTPHQVEGRGFRYFAFAKRLLGIVSASPEPQAVGSITYTSGKRSQIRVPAGDENAVYNLTIDGPETVPGFFIPSHRPEFRYQRVDQLPLRPRRWREDAFGVVQSSIRSVSTGGGGPSTSFHIKEVLIGLALFGYGNEVVEPDDQARALYESFQEALRKILPANLGFKSIAVRDRSEVVLVTRTGDFLIDAVSGGVAALVELAWQIFMFSPPKGERYAVVIDEPENHLHAAMQRRLLPSFLDAFQDCQFVVATHSPLIVGSVRESNVFALRFGQDGLVRSEQLSLLDKSGSAEAVLREVLDVEVSMPMWAESALNDIVDRYTSQPLTREAAKRLRVELEAAGLSRFYSASIAKIAEQAQP